MFIRHTNFLKFVMSSALSQCNQQREHEARIIIQKDSSALKSIQKGLKNRKLSFRFIQGGKSGSNKTWGTSRRERWIWHGRWWVWFQHGRWGDWARAWNRSGRSGSRRRRCRPKRWRVGIVGRRGKWRWRQWRDRVWRGFHRRRRGRLRGRRPNRRRTGKLRSGLKLHFSRLRSRRLRRGHRWDRKI